MLCSRWSPAANANAPELPFWSGRAAADLLLKKRDLGCVGSAVCGLLWCSFWIELVWISRLWTSWSWPEGSAPADDCRFVGEISSLTAAASTDDSHVKVPHFL